MLEQGKQKLANKRQTTTEKITFYYNHPQQQHFTQERRSEDLLSENTFPISLQYKKKRKKDI